MAEQSEPARRESLQRVQFGLIGVGAVLLVVAFANIVVKSIRPDGGQSVVVAGQSPTVTTTGNATTDSEPLADLGVTPKSDQSSVGASVPDLEPDPRLNKPMDRDPKKPGAAQRR